MQLKTYLQFFDTSFEFADYQEYTANSTNKINIPKRFTKVRLSCRLVEETSYKGKEIILESPAIKDAFYDFTEILKISDPNERLDQIKKGISKIIRDTNLDVKYTSMSTDLHLAHYVSYNKESHVEFDGTEYKVRSNELWDLIIPKDCIRFDTYDKLERYVSVEGQKIVLASPKLHEEFYIIADETEIEGMGKDKYLKFIKNRRGGEYGTFKEDNLISPSCIGEDGRILAQGKNL